MSERRKNKREDEGVKAKGRGGEAEIKEGTVVARAQ
jgi:hypothetical protein